MDHDDTRCSGRLAALGYRRNSPPQRVARDRGRACRLSWQVEGVIGASLRPAGGPQWGLVVGPLRTAEAIMTLTFPDPRTGRLVTIRCRRSLHASLCTLG